LACSPRTRQTRTPRHGCLAGVSTDGLASLRRAQRCVRAGLAARPNHGCAAVCGWQRDGPRHRRGIDALALARLSGGAIGAVNRLPSAQQRTNSNTAASDRTRRDRLVPPARSTAQAASAAADTSQATSRANCGRRARQRGPPRRSVRGPGQAPRRVGRGCGRRLRRSVAATRDVTFRSSSPRYRASSQTADGPGSG